MQTNSEFGFNLLSWLLGSKTAVHTQTCCMKANVHAVYVSSGFIKKNLPIATDEMILNAMPIDILILLWKKKTLKHHILCQFIPCSQSFEQPGKVSI